MNKRGAERTEQPFHPATATERGLGNFLLGSPRSRAAARSLAIARQESQAEDDWDNEPDLTELAERLSAARKRMRESLDRGEVLERDYSNWTPIYIPPGKENTVRGRLVARLRLRDSLLC
jgi:hypothetical protein